RRGKTLGVQRVHQYARPRRFRSQARELAASEDSDWMDTSERQIKRIVLERMDRCSVCHRTFEPDDIHVLSRKPDVWMMVVQCEDCQARNFVAALIGDGDPAAARMALRELSAEQTPAGAEVEPDRATTGEPLGIDDVIEMHEFLQTFDGDFKSLFARSHR